MINGLNELVSLAVTDVFGTMLSCEMTLEPPGSEIVNGEANVASSVGFIGELTGVVYVYATCSLAKRLTGNLLGMEPDEIEGDDMVNDAMGEIANMIVGHVKTHMADRGMSCVLTIPSIVRGSHFSVEATSSTTRRLFSFRSTTKDQVVVEILIKPHNQE